MAWDSFGESWFGVVFNPAGYLLGRKSNSNAANDYLVANPTNKMLSGLETELEYKEDRRKWTDACASKLKSDDVGKSKANALSACEKSWDTDTFAAQTLEDIQQETTAKESELETTLKKRSQILFIVAVAASVALLLWFILKNKNLVSK